MGHVVVQCVVPAQRDPSPPPDVQMVATCSYWRDRFGVDTSLVARTKTRNSQYNRDNVVQSGLIATMAMGSSGLKCNLLMRLDRIMLR